jgi:phosphoglycerate dehydrogenase-like enzyme
MSLARVLVMDTSLQPGEPGGIRMLEEAGVDLRFQSLPISVGAQEFARYLDGCIGVLAGSHVYNDELFTAVPDLRIVARLGVGYDAIDLKAATGHDVAVTTTPGTLEFAVADHVFGMILNLAHHIGQDDRAIRRGEWRPMWGFDVWRKTLGIAGMGRIGKMVVQRARGFEMRILAYDPYPDVAFAEANGVELVSFEELLRQSDYLTLHMPMQPDTAKLINAQTLALMKPTAFLINCARGGVIDEDALYDALASGRIAGAGLDVRAVEPPTDNRFAEFENVVLTPHDSGTTDGRRLACGSMAAGSVLSVIRGEKPAGLLNHEVWPSLERRLRSS